MAKNIKPEFSRTAVNKAGESVRTGTQTIHDLEIIENWRIAHNKVLNDWQATMRDRCKGKSIIFAQRLKRKSTIFNKLKRQPGMVLARMHDIAGCRLIFNSISEIYDFRQSLHSASKKNMKHILRKADTIPYPYDYINYPHSDKSGYRGIHDIFEYVARTGRAKDWNKLMIEIQYRTHSQHAWATANEIAGSLTGNYSKFGDGDERQQEFFRLTSEMISRVQEGITSCYPDLTNKELVKRFLSIEFEIKLFRRLRNIKLASENVDYVKTNVILIHDEDENTLTVNSYKTLPEAQTKYFELEKQHSGKRMDIVLVRALTGDSVRQAYKNYFSDAQDFTRLVQNSLSALRTRNISYSKPLELFIR